jgi:hypothetical protein
MQKLSNMCLQLRFPYERVRSAADHLVLGLDGDGRTPILPEVNARPHGPAQTQRLTANADDKRDEAIRDDAPS